MGYDTHFSGCFKLNKPLDKKTARLINGLNRTRRMKRDLTKLGMSNKRAAKYGVDGEFYIPPKSNQFGQDEDASIIDYNEPPETQPGLWCKWRYNKKECCIEWDGMEKFSFYVPWLQYLIEKVLKPEYILNGEVRFGGEYPDDIGTITIVDNIITVMKIEEYDAATFDEKLKNDSFRYDNRTQEYLTQYENHKKMMADFKNFLHGKI